MLEADPAGNIVWQFGLGPNDFSSRSIIGCNDAQRVGADTLRQYGVFGKTGSTPNRLNTPVQCTWLPSTDVLITDQGNGRIIEVTLSKKIVWQYPGSNTNPADQLNNPNSAELLENGHILIADENNNRAIEVNRDHQVLKVFTAGASLGACAFASRLDDGNTLLTDAGNSRAVEVDANDKVVWQYVTDKARLSVPAPSPTRAVRLANGDTLISDQFNNRVIRVSHAKVIVASYGLPLAGTTGIAGSGIGDNVGYDLNTTQKGLYSPYDAKIVGDYTGLTPPF